MFNDTRWKRPRVSKITPQNKKASAAFTEGKPYQKQSCIAITFKVLVSKTWSTSFPPIFRAFSISGFEGD